MHLTPFSWLAGSFYLADGALAAFFLSASQVGQAFLAVMIAGVGFILNRKSKEIHVLVNQRMSDATEQIRLQNLAMIAQDQRIAVLENALALEPGQQLPPDPSTPKTRLE